MKKILVMLALVAFVAAPAMAGPAVGGTFYFRHNGITSTFTSVSDNTVLTLYPGSSSGGAFTVSGTIVGHTTPFTTYCIENGIYFTPGVAYTSSIDTAAFQGHAAVPVMGDPISDVTENIYGNWYYGVTTNNNLYANNLGFATVAIMKANQAAISKAIWWAEGEASGVKNSVAQAMLSALGYNVATTVAGDLAAATNVKALNLWSFGPAMTTQYGITGWWANDVQTQLILTNNFTPAPLPGAALLGMLGVGMVGWIRRRFA